MEHRAEHGEGLPGVEGATEESALKVVLQMIEEGRERRKKGGNDRVDSPASGSHEENGAE